MIALNGCCKYCGQIRIVQVSEDKKYTQEELDKIAESECDCDIATRFRKRNEAYGNLRGMLDERFPDDAIEEKARRIKKLLLITGRMMSDAMIDSITINGGKESISLVFSPKLTYKLKIKSTETEVQEA